MLYVHTEVLALPALSLPCVGVTKALKTDTPQMLKGFVVPWEEGSRRAGSEGDAETLSGSWSEQGPEAAITLFRL